MKNICKNFFVILFLSFITFSPYLASAQGTGGGCNLASNPKFNTLVDYGICIINSAVIPFIIGLALVFFIYGVMQYVLNEADEGKREKGKQFMVWGIIALTVMLSVWALVGILGGTFGLNVTVIPEVSPN